MAYSTNIHGNINQDKNDQQANYAPKLNVAVGLTPSLNLAAAGIELISLDKMMRKCDSRQKVLIKLVQSRIFHALELPRTRMAYLYHGLVMLTFFVQPNIISLLEVFIPCASINPFQTGGGG